MQKSDLKSCGSKKVWPKKSVTWKVWHKKYDLKKKCDLLFVDAVSTMQWELTVEISAAD